MKKQTIKLNESQLRSIIRESIKEALSEGPYSVNGQIDRLENQWKHMSQEQRNSSYGRSVQQSLNRLYSQLPKGTANPQAQQRVNPNAEQITEYNRQIAQLQQQIENIKYNYRYTSDQKIKMQDQLLNKIYALKEKIKKLNNGVMAWH